MLAVCVATNVRTANFFRMPAGSRNGLPQPGASARHDFVPRVTDRAIASVNWCLYCILFLGFVSAHELMQDPAVVTKRNNLWRENHSKGTTGTLQKFAG